MTLKNVICYKKTKKESKIPIGITKDFGKENNSQEPKSFKNSEDIKRPNETEINMTSYAAFSN